ncbi:MAG: hypothetical protein V4597_00830 [Pseudomonadota bacterium]
MVLGRYIRRAAPLAVAVGLVCPGLALANMPATCGDAQARNDQKILDSALEYKAPAALATMVPALEEVLSHAPASYPQIEQVGKVYRIRGIADDKASSLTLMLMVTAASEHRSAQAVRCPDTYPNAALLAGVYWNEVKAPEKALAALDRGYALRPGDSKLVTERGISLLLLKRLEEAIAMYSTWLEGVSNSTNDSGLVTMLSEMTDKGADRDRARVLRARAFSYVELNKLDLAEADYNASLVLEPGNGRALGELNYIAGLRGGSAPTAVVIGTVKAPRD